MYICRDSVFDIDQLAVELGMWRSTLHRRVKALTGKIPHDFIVEQRLKHACEWLSKSKLNIYEVACTVGFTSPKYFTGCSKEQYDITSTDYQKGKKRVR